MKQPMKMSKTFQRTKTCHTHNLVWRETFKWSMKQPIKCRNYFLFYYLWTKTKSCHTQNLVWRETLKWRMEQPTKISKLFPTSPSSTYVSLLLTAFQFWRMQRAHGKIQSRITWLAYEYCCKITARQRQRFDPCTCTKFIENHIKSQQQHHNH
jgi:hypothetical protein